MSSVLLGLRHGGGDDINCKPNYMSIMNYAQRLISNPQGKLDYSRIALPSLNEDNLDETRGFQVPPQSLVFFNQSPDPGKSGHMEVLRASKVPIDWDGDGTQNNAMARSDLNYFIPDLNCGKDVDSNNDGKLDEPGLVQLSYVR